MVKPGPTSNSDKLLTLWFISPKEPGTPQSLCKIPIKKVEKELPFSIILKRATKELGLGKRTTINYLNILLKKKKLRKRVDNTRNTYYKVIIEFDMKKWLFTWFVDNCLDESAEWLLDYVIDFSCNAFEKFSSRKEEGAHTKKAIMQRILEESTEETLNKLHIR